MKKKKSPAMIGLVMTDDQMDQIDRLCRRFSLSRAAFVRLLVIRELEKNRDSQMPYVNRDVDSLVVSGPEHGKIYNQ